MRLRDLTLLALLLLTGCTSFPEVDRAGARYGGTAGAAPALVPLEDVLAAAGTGRPGGQITDALFSRADKLRARAASLRRPD